MLINTYSILIIIIVNDLTFQSEGYADLVIIEVQT
jgi:hypothetical protein